MANDDTVRPRRRPRYDAEDTSPTTDRELKGWYAYGLAAEAFAVCGVGSFLPVTLEQLARERGVLWSDKTTSCVAKATSHGAAEGAPSVTSLFVRGAAPGDNGQCVIHVFGAEITTASFAMYTFSLAVLVQALALISFSAVADYGNYRKRLLLGFGFTGAIATMLFLLVVPSLYLLGSALVVVGVTCLGSSFVLLNSYLPLLVLNHPSGQSLGSSSVQRSPDIALEALSAQNEHYEPGDVDTLDAPSLSSSKIKPEMSSFELQLSTKISSKGVGTGYCSAVFVQCLSIVLLFSLSKTSLSSSSPTLPLRLVLFLVGFWWFAFTLPSAWWLRDRPGPPLKAAIPRRGSKLRSYLAYLSFSWVSLWKTIKVAAKLRQAVVFLVAWFLLSDAIATVSGTAILFARTELNMGTVPIALLSITATTSGIAGAFSWPLISRALSLRTNQTIIACIILMEVIPIYGLLGYVPFVKTWGVGGLQQAWEIYPLGVIHGFVMGGLSSYCRSFFGQFIPPGSEAAFYALYAITDKGSSAFGPAIVGVIVDKTGTIRPAFAFLAVLIALPAPLIWMVDAERGRADAIRMTGALKVAGGGEDGLEFSTEDDIQEGEGLLTDETEPR